MNPTGTQLGDGSRYATTSLLNGDVLAQSGSFSNSTVTGNYVAYEVSASNGDGVSTFPTSLDSALVYLSVQSGNQFAITIDENGGQGQITLEKSQGPYTYSIDSNGRMTLGSGQPVFYPANGAQAFGTEQPSSTNQGGPSLITVQQQVSGTFGCAATTGTFAVGTPQAPTAINVTNGISNLSTDTFTIDQSDPYGVLNLGLTGTITCTTDSLSATTGRFVLTNNFGSTQVGYTVVPSKYVLMPIDPFNGQPNAITVEK